MSRSIDERVVEMQFDNAQFEKGVGTTLNSLDKLKQSLNFNGAEKGLDELSGRVGNFDMSSMASAVETVQQKFSALQVMAITALVNITNQAIQTGERLVKSLSIDQVSAGWDKYGQKTASVQTIMNATGKSIDEVNGYLDKLMWFSDETSYGFTDMTSALGQLTSAGGDIDKLIPMITGIANATAYAGKGTAEFSRSIYNLNQSYSAGSLQYMDWKSLELAGVASKELKQTFIDTGVALGKIKKGEVTIANFGQTLKDKWADTSVMEKAFGKFGEMTEKAYQMVQAGEVDTASEAYKILAEKYDGVSITAAKAAQEAKTFAEAIDATKDAVSSGWMKTFEIIFGNYQEAKLMWTDLANTLWDVFASGSEARNALLQEWKELGGRDSALNAVANVFHSLEAVVTPIKTAFREMFPKATADQIFNITKSVETFTEKLKIGDETADKIRRTFAGVFAVIGLVKDILSAAIGVVGHFIGLFVPSTASNILDVTAAFGDMLVKFRELVTSSNFLTTAYEAITKGLDILADTLKTVGQKIADVFGLFKSTDSKPLETLSDTADKAIRPMSRLGDAVSTVFGLLVKVLEWAAPIVVKMGDAISVGLTSMGDQIGKAMSDMDFSTLLDTVNTGLFGALILGIKKFVGTLNKGLDMPVGFMKNIKGVLEDVRGTLQSYQSTLNAKTLKTIATAIGILAASLFVLSLVDSAKLTVALGAITGLFLNLTIAMKSMSKALGGVKMAKISAQMVAMSAAILVLSIALASLARLDWDQLAVGIVGIGALTTMLVTASAILSKTTKRMMKGSVGLILFAAALSIMADAVKKLSTLNWEQLGVGLTGFTVILGEIIAATMLLKGQKLISAGVGLIALGGAMLIMAEALTRMGALPIEQIGRGLTAMSGSLLSVSLAMRMLPKDMISKSVGMTVVASAMLILAEAVKKFSTLQWEDIGRGLASMAGALLSVSLAMKLMPKDILQKSVGLTVVSASLLVLAEAVKSMAGMQWDEIGRGMTVLAGSLGILAIALNVMKTTTGGALALLIAAPALVILAGALKLFGSISMEDISAGLFALAGTFTVLGLATMLLKPLIPAMIGLAAATALLGVGVTAIGVGVLAFSTGLGALAVSASSAGAAIVILGSSILSLIPTLFKKLGEGLVELANVVIKGAPAIGEALLTMLRTALKVVIEAAPMIAEAALTLVESLLTTLEEHLPAVTDKLFSVITGFLDKLAENMPELITSGAKVLRAFIDGVFSAMGQYKPESLTDLVSCFALLAGAFAVLAGAKHLAKDAIIGAAAMAAVMLIIGGIFAAIASFSVNNIVDISASLSLALISMSASMGILSLIPTGAAIGAVKSLAIFIAGLSALLLAAGAIKQIPGVEWLVSEGSQFLAKIGEAIGGFVGSIIGGFLNGVSSSFPKIGKDLSDFMTNATPFIKGASGIDKNMSSGIGALVDAIGALTGQGFLNGIANFFAGGSVLVMFGQELATFGPYFSRYYNSIKGIDAGVVTASTNATQALSNIAKNLPKKDSLIGWIRGDMSLTDFANELATFGPSLMSYARSIAGLSVETVAASANAANVLSQMAANLPDQGGIVTWFAGDNRLSVFGEELANFGPYLMAYANSIAGLDTNVVINSANAAKALSELATNLPDSGGLLSIFKGDNNIVTFGMNLADFGYYFSLYYDHIKGISFTQTQDVAASLRALIDLAERVTSANIKGLTTFANDLRKQGDLGVTGFLSAFVDSNTRVMTAMNIMIGYMLSAISTGQVTVTTQMNTLLTAMIQAVTMRSPEMATAGTYMMTQFANAIFLQQEYTVGICTGFIQACLDSINARSVDWETAAFTLINSFSNGLALNSGKVIDQAKELGKNIVLGLADGIRRNGSYAIDAAVSVALAALAAAKMSIKVKSPSRAFAEVGMYADLGFAKGLTDYSDVPSSAAANMAKTALNTLRDSMQLAAGYLGSNIDMAPTIRPVLDLTDVANGARQINSLLSTRQAAAISSGLSAEIGQNRGSNNGPSYNFVQNNYSPKSLSTVEIYRQTHNQLAQLKGAVISR